MRPFIAANWKLHKTVEESVETAARLKIIIEGVNDRDILVCPPFTALEEIYHVIEGTNIMLGAQDVFWEEEGAFTGEVSPEMLKNVGCEYVIIGHSERRKYFNETDETVNKKIRASFADELKVILCVGETEEMRDQAKHRDFVEKELEDGLKNISSSDAKMLAVAYEPIWAIGTGQTATPEQAQEMHAFIRDRLSVIFDQKTADSIRILYGGSVKPDNVKELMSQKDINGALVGGASLDAESFGKIIKGF
ncbi:triose-phosphate isomerase [Candidatus Woesearchaeota archaeon]|nr:triose-phosphate isomerase [Candidatus Woesearchaeota archaeon]